MRKRIQERKPKPGQTAEIEGIEIINGAPKLVVVPFNINWRDFDGSLVKNRSRGYIDGQQFVWFAKSLKVAYGLSDEAYDEWLMRLYEKA